MDRAGLAAHIDHTLLAPEATPDEVRRTCLDGAALGVAAVCLSPRWVPLAVEMLTGPGAPAVCTVIGFPSGAHRSEIKAAEAAQAIRDGATEIDMVVALGDVQARRWEAVALDLSAVRSVVPDEVVLKVIVESAALDDERLRRACDLVATAGADYVKTSTGFHPAGGASVHAVHLMREVVGGTLGIKASGGIRDLDTARAMLAAGATRLGMSSTAAVLDQCSA